MDASEGTAKFRQAETYFQQGQFQEALALLEELDEAYPNTKNVMSPRALCLERLGRLDEAEAICDSLLQQFMDAGSQAMKERIQAARSTLDPMAGLNMNALDDLFDKPVKRTPPPVQQDSSGLLRYVVIGIAVAVIVGAGVFAYSKGLLSMGGENMEQVQAKIIDAWSKAEAYSAVLDLKAQVKQAGMELAVNGGGSVDFMKKDGKNLFRIESSASVTGMPMPLDVSIQAVGDGANAYVMFTFMGKTTAVKAPMPPSAQLTPDVGKLFFENFQKEFDLRLLREEMLEGKPAYPFEMTPKAGSEAAASISKSGQDFAKLKVYFTKDLTSQVRCVAFDKAGKQLLAFSVKDINFKPSLAPEKFVFKAPAGVQVQDVSDASSLMKMMP